MNEQSLMHHLSVPMTLAQTMINECQKDQTLSFDHDLYALSSAAVTLKSEGFNSWIGKDCL
jgi:hypothetical protein